jgi:hypothetical protein
MQMLSTRSSKCYFFNYLIHEGKEFYHEIIVQRDEELILKIKERIAEAVEIKNQYINKIKNNRQWK